MLFKKTMVAMIVFISASTSFANNGYVGLGVGYDTTDFYKTLQIKNKSNNALIYDKKDNLYGNGVVGEMFAGYQWQLTDVFSLASELSANVNSLTYQGYYVDVNQSEQSNGVFKINKNVGFSVLPGFNINATTMLYARLGMVRGKFNYQEYKTLDGDKIGINDDRWLNGLRLGLGAKMAISENVALRLEYNYLQYQTYTDKSFALNPALDRTIKLTPKSHQMLISVSYAL
jgi:opacity protein-like surface antigen